MAGKLSLREQVNASEARASHWHQIAKHLFDVVEHDAVYWAERTQRAELFLQDKGWQRCSSAACRCDSWHRRDA